MNSHICIQHMPPASLWLSDSMTTACSLSIIQQHQRESGEGADEKCWGGLFVLTRCRMQETALKIVVESRLNLPFASEIIELKKKEIINKAADISLKRVWYEIKSKSSRCDKFAPELYSPIINLNVYLESLSYL